MKLHLDYISMGCGAALALGCWSGATRLAAAPLNELRPAFRARAQEDPPMRVLQEEIAELRRHLRDLEDAVLEVAPEKHGVAVELVRGARTAVNIPVAR